MTERSESNGVQGDRPILAAKIAEVRDTPRGQKRVDDGATDGPPWANSERPVSEKPFRRAREGGRKIKECSESFNVWKKSLALSGASVFSFSDSQRVLQLSSASVGLATSRRPRYGKMSAKARGVRSSERLS